MPDENLIQLTIKSVPSATREVMNRLAQKRGVNLGTWLKEAVAQAERTQAGELLVSPEMFEQTHGRMSSVVPAARIGLPISPEELMMLMAAAKDSPAKGTAKLAAGLMNAYLKTVRDMLPSPPARR